MKRRLIFALASMATIAVAAAGLALARDAQPPTVVRAGNMILSIAGGVAPQILPRDSFAPVGFYSIISFGTVDGAQPPALKQVVVDADKDVVVDVTGLPTCRKSQLESRDTASAIQACPKAIFGRGRGTVQVAFPEQPPFSSTGPLVLFNGGEEGGVTTLYIHAFVNVPAPTAIVTTAKITRVHNGPYGTHAVFNIPPIAGGNGAVTKGELSARRIYTYKGKRHSVLSARCSDGRIVARSTFEFRDNSTISASFLAPCKAVD